MITVWIKENDMAQLTSLSGNIDADKLLPWINVAQTTEMKRVLGKDLWEKINTDIKNGTPFSGDYLIIFDDYIVPMLVYYSCVSYIGLGAYKIANAGIFKKFDDGSTIATKDEIAVLQSSYRQLAASVEQAFYDFMKTINITEFAKSTDDENPRYFPWV